MKSRMMILAALSACLAMGGCLDFKTNNPYHDPSDPATGPAKVTESELMVLARMEENRIKAEEEGKAETLRAVMEEREVDFRAAVTRLTSEAQMAVADLERRYEMDSARTNRELAAIAADSMRRNEERKAKFDMAQADLERQREALTLGLGAVQTYGGAIPVVGGALVGLAGLVSGFMGRKKLADATWDESAAKKEEEFKERERQWELSQADLLKTIMAMGGGVLAKIGPAPESPAAAVGT